MRRGLIILLLLASVGASLLAGTETTPQASIPRETLAALDALNGRLKSLLDGFRAGTITEAAFETGLGDAFRAFDDVLAGMPSIYGLPFGDVFYKLFDVHYALDELAYLFDNGCPFPYAYADELLDGLWAKNSLEWQMGGGRVSQQAACTSGKVLVMVYPGFDCHKLMSRLRELVNAGKCVTVSWREAIGYNPPPGSSGGPTASRLFDCLGSTFQTGPMFRLDPGVELDDEGHPEAELFGDPAATVHASTPPTSKHPALKDSALASDVSRGVPTRIDPNAPFAIDGVIKPWYSIDELCAPAEIRWDYYDPAGALAYSETSTLDPSEYGSGCLKNYSSSGWTVLAASSFGAPGVYTVELWFDGTYSAMHRFTVAGAGPLPPIAYDDFYSVDEDAVLDASSSPVTTNDLDPNGDPLQTTLATPPQHGDLVFQPDGAFVYTPYADFYGLDGFTYTVVDPAGQEASGRATILVNPVNDPPMAHNEALTFTGWRVEGASEWRIETPHATWMQTIPDDAPPVLHVPAPGVLLNDVDPDGDPLVVGASRVPEEYRDAVHMGENGGIDVRLDALPGFDITDDFSGTHLFDFEFDYDITDPWGGIGTGQVDFQLLDLAEEPAPL